MNEYIDILSKSFLFENVNKNEILNMIECLNGKIINKKKGDYIFKEGDDTSIIGVVLKGLVNAIAIDYYGNESVLTIMQPSMSFGEIFICANLKTYPVSTVCQKDSIILILNLKNILQNKSKTCIYSNILIINLIKQLANKNLDLTQKINYMSIKKTKDKVYTYLLDQAKLNNKNEFIIPCDRQTLANFLGVDRSSLSTIINQLQKDGLIKTKGSWFYINKR